VQAFSAWIHVCAIRLFVESILRYGLPPRFLAVLMKPNPKGVAKLRKTLANTFGQKGALKHSTCVQPHVPGWQNTVKVQRS
jgi:V-type H+-transporting ATPase subunit C